MIDVKDLRIGNYISTHDKNYHDEVYIVGSLFYSGVVGLISFDEIALIEQGEKILPECTFHTDVKGIPITPEWLIKLGFTRNHDDGEFDHKDNENVIILCEDDGYTFDYECGGIEWCQCGVEYVHQLQNFYYLTTGQELTIGGGV